MIPIKSSIMFYANSERHNTGDTNNLDNNAIQSDVEDRIESD